MTQHEDWTPDTERAAYTAWAQAVVENLAEYEQAHTPGSPCLHDALAIAREVLQP